MKYVSFSGPEWTAAGADTRDLVERIGDTLDGSLPVDDEVTAEVAALPFYDNYSLIALSSPKWDPFMRVCYLTDGGNMFRLNGTSPPIHEVNAKAPVQINEANALAYLSFFCFFVRGDEGPFYVLHDLEDELLPTEFRDGTDEILRSAVSRVMRSPRLFGKSGNEIRASALVYYSNAIFSGDFRIAPSGMVEMAGDRPLMGELSVAMKWKLTGNH